MRTTIDCFIPFSGVTQVQQTIKGLLETDLINKIYLLATEDTHEEVNGCETIVVSSLNSSAAMHAIAARSTATFTLLYTKYTTLEFGLHALERIDRKSVV